MTDVPDTQKDKKDVMMPTLSTDALMHIFDFDNTTLNTNRSGFPTRNQKEWLKESLKEDADSMWLLLTLLMVGAVAAGIAMAASGLPMLPLVIGAGLMIGAMLLFSYLRQNNARADLDNLKVRSIEGIPQVATNRTYSYARLQIGDTRFEIDADQARALQEFRPAPMRVYFMQNSKQIVAAEVAYDADIEKLKVEDLQQDDEAILELGRQYDDEQQQQARR